MIIAALDFGKRRIGIAITDPDEVAAYPVATIGRRSLIRDLELIASRLVKLEATHIVVGLPLNMDGTMGPQARAAESFAQHVREATGLAVDMYDERLTSFEADERLKALPRRKRSKPANDAIAAAVILEGWLDSRGPRGG
jgi:putative Holliday junction resolvase